MKSGEEKKMTFHFQRFISFEEQGEYIEVPFEMPEAVEELIVSYRVESVGADVIDLGVRDGTRVRGWSGGARSEFRIGWEHATPGYVPGELAAGGWAVLHNAYRVPAEGCNVFIDVECRLEYHRWLKGDLHMHSIHSDGTYTLEENARIVEELGCDFLAMTDHNTISQNLSYPRNTVVVMIPGMELTTNFGHANFLGVSDPADDFRANGQTDVNRIIAEARSRGARIVLNHPHCSHCPWLWDFAVDYDWLEVWNGPWREDNERTLQWWQEQLTQGRRLTAVGGSDTHRPHPYVKHAMPTTWVYSRSKTVNGILEGIGRGHVSLSFAPSGPFASMEYGEFLQGDIVPSHESSHLVTVSMDRVLQGDQVKIISCHGVESETVVADAGSFSMEPFARENNRRFYRLEVWRHFSEVNRTLLAAMTNPIYFEGDG